LRKLTWRFAVFREADSLDKLWLPILTLPLVRNMFAKKLLRNRISHIGGLRLRILDYNSIAIFSSDFEFFMEHWFKPESAQTVVDVGAHVGKYTLRACRMVGPAGRVIAIEAHPINYSLLVENVRLNGGRNVRTVRCAAWNVRTKLGLFIGCSSGHHSLKFDDGRGCLQVQTRTIDDILEEHEIEQVDWIKIDVEGAEVEVLEGARKTITTSRPKIILEVRPFQIHKLRKLTNELRYEATEIESSSGRSPGYWFLAPMD
jgi:FkbM family methyltransferase